MTRNNSTTADKVEKVDGGQGKVSPNAFGFGVLGVLILTVLLGLAMTMPAWANNIAVGTVTLTEQNTTSDYTHIKFNISWENSWKVSTGPSNWDAAWVFVKYKETGGGWKHATMINDKYFF